MKKILQASDNIPASCNENGGPIEAMRKIAKELEIKLTFYTPGKGTPLEKVEPFVCFLEMRFQFQPPIPRINSVSGEGPTIDAAKEKAALEAIGFLKLMCAEYKPK